MTVNKIGSRWIARCSYHDRAIPKAAGFRWDPANKQWFTSDASIAAKLSDPEAAAKARDAAKVRDAAKAAAVEASRAADSDVELPCPDGLAYLPYQRAGIAAALKREAVLFGDEMGLGKTIQAIGVINTDTTLNKILIVCPASLRLNWYRELQRWLTRKLSIMIADGSIWPAEHCNVTICNYDILAKHQQRLREMPWDLIICDEAHYLKNPEAKRTQAIVGKIKKGKVEIEPVKARRRILLTGTPVPNRPIEGWPLFHYLDPVEFSNFWGYARRYCDATQNGYGWDMSGASNLGELQNKLRGSIMIRRLKADVLKELPAKRRCIIELPANGAAGAVKAEQTAWAAKESRLAELRAAVELAKASDDPEVYQDAVFALRAAANAAFTELSKLRHDTAVKKIPYVIEHVRNAIEDGSKVVVFAHHKDVILALAEEFGPAAVSLYGETPMATRQANVDRFQKDPSCLVFIGGIMAAGVGLTLTAASHVVFAELDWVPGNVTQAEDRCHRIGQRDSVLVEHLVFEGSLDVKMARTLVAKQEVIESALDKEAPAVVVPVTKEQRAATEDTPRARIEAEAAKMTPERIAAIHQGLQVLAAMDQDHARDLNGIGFSRIDNMIGHSLAQAGRLSAKQAALGFRIVSKYRRQLSDELVTAARG